MGGFARRWSSERRVNASDGQRFLMIKPAETTEEGSRNDVILVQNFSEEMKRLVPTD